MATSESSISNLQLFDKMDLLKLGLLYVETLAMLLGNLVLHTWSYPWEEFVLESLGSLVALLTITIDVSLVALGDFALVKLKLM